MTASHPDVPEWPEQPKTAAPEMGHNKPPVEEDVKAQFREGLIEQRADIFDVIDRLEGSADRVKVEDEETLGRAGDLVKMIRAASKIVVSAHTVVKAPYLAAGRVCDAEKNGLVARLDKAKAKTEAPMNEFVREQARKEREAQEAAARAERERQKAEREAEQAAKEKGEMALPPPPPPPPPPAPPPAEKEPVRSDGGTTISTRKEYVSQILDYTVAFMAVEDDEKVRDAIDKAIQRRVRAGVRKIEGVSITEHSKVVSV